MHFGTIGLWHTHSFYVPSLDPSPLALMILTSNLLSPETLRVTRGCGGA
jgi:hypothetical protein